MLNPPVEPVNILLVDDRPGNLAALRAILERPEYRLVEARSGMEALSRVLQFDFAVILLDVAMPEMDGFETAALIKQRERSANVPIIFVTASIYELEQIFRGYSIGAVDYLRKPVEPHVVQAKVSVFVELYRQKQEIRRQAELLRASEAREREAQRQRAEDVLQRSEARYEATFEHAPVGIAETNLDGRFLRANGRLSRILGVEPGDLIGRSLAEFAPADDAAALAAEISALAREEDRFLRREHRCLRPDARMVWVRTTIAVVRDRTGTPQTLVLVLEDVTEERWAEQTRRFLVDAGRVLLGALDRERTLRSVARLAVGGFCDWCVVELLGEDGEPETVAADHSDATLVRAIPRLRDDWKESESMLKDVLHTGEARVWRRDDTQSATGRELDGGLLAAESAVIVPLFARERIFGAITFVSTDRSRAYSESDVRMGTELALLAALAIDNARLFQEAQQAIAVRDEFLSVAAHELRTPLTPLRLLVQTFQKLLERGRNEEVLERLPNTFRRAERQIDRLVWLVDTLLDVSRIREGNLQIERGPVDLGALARDAADHFEEEARVAGCQLQLDIESAPGNWDRHRLEQVLSNLLGNAVKYGAGKEIEIRVRGGNPARLTVTDHGIGIAEELQHRIFEPFERAVSPLSYGGLGLGLYIARQIVEAHGGTISFHSEPGRATEFLVELPTEMRALAPPPAEHPPSP